MLLLSACGAAVEPTAVPTLTLIPVTETPTSTPPSPTATTPPRLNPDDLATTPTPPPAVIVPDDAEAFVTLAIYDLTAALDVPETALTLVELSAATWYTADHGCGDMPFVGNDPDDPIAIAGYRIVFTVEDATYAYHTDSEGTVRQCARPDVVVGEQRTLIEADPVAAELVALAKRRVAGLAGVDVAAVRLVVVRPYQWRDASLGCPLPGETYADVQVDGYRIVLAAGGDEYVFHTSFTDLVRCADGNETLPG